VYRQGHVQLQLRYGNTSSNREREQQRPSTLEDHSSNQGDNQNEGVVMA
jgi:hypothetical protein